MRRRIVATVIVSAVLAMSGADVSGGGRPLSTSLSGAEEAPGPGDSDATGDAHLTLNQGQQRVCFELSWADVDGTVVAAHIHSGPAGTPGPVIVGLFSGTAHPGSGSAAGCVEGVDPALIKEIRQNPSAYYVNVHSTSFQAGAVRGQLGD